MYGALVLAKVAGLVALAVFGAYHRGLVARVESAETARRLRASVAREIAVMLVVILLGGWLAYVPPPPSPPAGAPAGASPEPNAR